MTHLPPQSEQLREQQQSLETIRQQLLCMAGLLTSFISQTADRSVTENQQVLCDVSHEEQQFGSFGHVCGFRPIFLYS